MFLKISLGKNVFFSLYCNAGEDATYNGVWTCNHCRKMPLLLSDLKSEIVKLSSSLNNALTNEETLKDEIRKLKSDNGDLKKLIETMSDITSGNQHRVYTQSEGSATQHHEQPTTGLPAYNIGTSNRYAALAGVTEALPAPARRAPDRAPAPDPAPESANAPATAEPYLTPPPSSRPWPW